MSVIPFNFTTGPATLPDVGTLSYNGCTFSPLFSSKISGTVIKDNAKRTTKYMEYVLDVDGYVTLGAHTQDADIVPTMNVLRLRLTAHAGELIYTGRGFDLRVNVPTSDPYNFNFSARDVAWGPVPELMEFQPLGNAFSAKVKWRVTVRIAEIIRNPGAANPLLQFNCETTVGYSEDYYSYLSVKGTMEIPMTRSTFINRNLPQSVDALRSQLNTRIFAGVDLTRFRVVRRDYNISRDKRTMEFDVELEEKPYMDMPIACGSARGSYSVRPAEAGMGTVRWLCSLRAVYTVRKDRARRFAWVSFLALMQLRMAQSALGNVPSPAGGTPSGTAPTSSFPALFGSALFGLPVITGFGGAAGAGGAQRGHLIEFTIDEGLYQDSKTTAFSATSWHHSHHAC